jgi:hypothetical protein
VSPKIFTSLLKIRSDLYKSLDSERMILRLTQALWLASFRRLGLLAGLAEATDAATFVLELPLGLGILRRWSMSRQGS